MTVGATASGGDSWELYNEVSKKMWGVVVNIPLNGAGAGMDFTMANLQSAMDEIRRAGAPQDAMLKVWYDQDCYEGGLPIGPAMRVRAMWWMQEPRKEEERG